MDWFNFKFKAPKAGESLKEVFSNPMIYLTLLVVLAIAIVFVYISKVKLTTRTIIHVGIAIALAIVLKMFRIMQMPMGGSVTLGSMIPIIFIAYVYGPRVGYLTGMLFGVMDLLLGAYVVHPMQLLLDYVLAFGVLGVAGYFKNNISIGALVAIALRFLCHIASGVIFFSSYAGEQNALVYSILYNGTYLLPEAIIAMIILAVLPTKRLRTEISKGAY
ncbi:energy-coupled thiamine transporter ThiT [Clostridium algidicarnis]|uniref:Thiamine transporter n=1 Tax=Clostridium algidicarnis DSM 15099 TaxID=1121295 RepID=A0A2S6FWU3_9CLOT|nr:energy-coupled thiamine transporter ThiT [Clostridium algidicarnis]MBU3193633.1 energy-coupled thiamine transporter ThiT [Clostridium algidicarnis]MBU3197532.1 energy-coupled thiamine transporter ThiT [Clostridium algidicarnis]MCB2287564.1 energy-coupled thiamine transporter ThiT [Clostridium algidicarnis]PPK48061.1 thiamine transporter [Clostridium algidicarnis DSM 15099]